MVYLIQKIVKEMGISGYSLDRLSRVRFPGFSNLLPELC